MEARTGQLLYATLMVAAGAMLAACAHAQTPGKLPRVGVLLNGTAVTTQSQREGFERGLAELGYAPGRNIVLETRYAEGQLDRLPALVQELADLKPEVLFTPSALAANAARKAGVAMPVVFALAPDPVAEGFAASLARPGGNMTGLTSQSPDLAAKRVELLREALPASKRLAVLHASAFPGVPALLKETERVALQIGMDFLPVEAKRAQDLEAAIGEAVRRKADALLVIENPLFFTNRRTIIGLAERNRLPAIYQAREYVESGGLMSYGSNYGDLCRRAASHVVKILKGARPGDIPVEQPVKFDLVINLRTANAQRLAIPRALRVRADEVLE